MEGGMAECGVAVRDDASEGGPENGPDSDPGGDSEGGPGDPEGSPEVGPEGGPGGVDVDGACVGLSCSELGSNDDIIQRQRNSFCFGTYDEY